MPYQYLLLVLFLPLTTIILPSLQFNLYVLNSRIRPDLPQRRVVQRQAIPDTHIPLPSFEPCDVAISIYDGILKKDSRLEKLGVVCGVRRPRHVRFTGTSELFQQTRGMCRYRALRQSKLAA